MESYELDHGAGVTLAQNSIVRVKFALSATQLAARSLAGAVGRSNPICAGRTPVAHLQAVMGLSESRACSIVGADSKMVRYRSCPPPDGELSANVHDLANGWRFRILNVVDEVTKECIAAIPDTSMSGRRVARELTPMIELRGKLGMIFSDN
jgi:hypothetical protein